MFFVVGFIDKLRTYDAPGLHVWPSLIGLALLGTAVAYIVFFEILVRAGASNVMLVTLLLPVTGLFLGHIFLGEAIHTRISRCRDNRLGLGVHRWPDTPTGLASFLGCLPLYSIAYFR